MPCMLVAGLALQSNDWGSSLSGPTQPSILPRKVHEQGGNLRLARGELLGLTKGLKNLGAIAAGQGATTVCTLVMVVTAVLKAVSLSGGHTVATELPTNMGIKQSSSLTLAMYMYVCMYACMFVCLYVVTAVLQS